MSDHLSRLLRWQEALQQQLTNLTFPRQRGIAEETVVKRHEFGILHLIADLAQTDDDALRSALVKDLQHALEDAQERILSENSAHEEQKRGLVVDPRTA